MVTLRDIARELGLSVNTVSRALNGKPDVNRETRARVLETARDLGYVPNALAQSLVAGRSLSIGLVLSDVANPFNGKIIRGVEEAARERGYATVLANSNEQDDLERQAVQVLRSKRVDGMLIHPVQASEAHIVALEHDGIPVVLLNRHSDRFDISYVIINNASGAYQAVRHLVQLDHRLIAHITGPAQISSVRERITGYEKALDEAGLPRDPRLIVHAGLDMDAGYRAAHELLAAGPRPTAIFTYSDLIAIGVLKALSELHLQVPEDVSLVGFDDIDFASMLQVSLTTVHQPRAQIGRRGAEVLFELMEEPASQRLPRHVILEPELIIRGSTCPPAGKASHR